MKRKNRTKLLTSYIKSDKIKDIKIGDVYYTPGFENRKEVFKNDGS